MGPAVLLVQRILPPFNRVVGKIFGLGEDESRSVQDYSFDAIPVLRASWRDVRSLSVCTVAWYGNWWVRFMESMEFRAAWRFVKILTPQKKGYEANSGFYKVVWERKGRKSPKRRFCDLSDHLNRFKFMNHIIIKFWNTVFMTTLGHWFQACFSSFLLHSCSPSWSWQQHHRAIIWGELGKSVDPSSTRDFDTEWIRRITNSFFSVSKFTSVWTPGE